MAIRAEQREGIIDFYSCSQCESLECEATPDFENCIRISAQPSWQGRFFGRWIWVRNPSIGLIKYFAVLGYDARWKIDYRPNQQGYKAILKQNPPQNLARNHHHHCPALRANDIDPRPLKKFKG